MTDVAARPAPPRVADLGQALGSLLRAYLDQARDVLAGLPGGPRGYQLMTVADAGTCGNQAEMAALLGLDRTVMTHLVDDLEAAGLVERRPDPADRRARRVLITAQGRTTLRDTAAAISDVEHGVLSALNGGEAELFVSLLAKATAADATAPAQDLCAESADPSTC